MDLSKSTLVKYEAEVSQIVPNYFLVRLMDSYYNPVASQAQNLDLKIVSLDHHKYCYPFNFKENNNGTYTGGYMIMDPGRHELSITFKGQHFLPYPFGVNVLLGKFKKQINILSFIL